MESVRWTPWGDNLDTSRIFDSASSELDVPIRQPGLLVPVMLPNRSGRKRPRKKVSSSPMSKAWKIWMALPSCVLFAGRVPISKTRGSCCESRTW